MAGKYLRKNNYFIINKNFRCQKGEVDIIAKDLQTQEIVFVEVKTRTNLKYGTPREAVNKNKQKHIYKTAEYYLFCRQMMNNRARIDVIEVFIKKRSYKINHLKQVI